MLDRDEFSGIRERMGREDAVREEVIKRSRDVLKASKHAIYACQRGELANAHEHIMAARRTAGEIAPLVKEHPRLREGSYGSALEEYVEACAMHTFLKEGRLVRKDELGLVTDEEYLLGLCDVAGELGRHAVHRATERDIAAVRRVRELLDALLGELLQFDFRNGELRRKYDGVKYSVQKVEQLLYELALRVHSPPEPG